MNYKQIETSREIRLWIGQVLVPAAVLMAACPEARRVIGVKIKQTKDTIRTKLSK